MRFDVNSYEGCIGLESQRLCECVHGFIVKVPLVLDVSINNSVLDMYSSLLDLDAAVKYLMRWNAKMLSVGQGKQ